MPSRGRRMDGRPVFELYATGEGATIKCVCLSLKVFLNQDKKNPCSFPCIRSCGRQKDFIGYHRDKNGSLIVCLPQ